MMGRWRLDIRLMLLILALLLPGLTGNTPLQAPDTRQPTAFATEMAPIRTPGEPMGHIAFSFWNRAAARCTYEINLIDVAACRQGEAVCQAYRYIFPLNNVSEPALSPAGDRLAFRGWGEPSDEKNPFRDCAPPFKGRYLVNASLTGSDMRPLGGFWEDGHPDWSPDGQRLLFDSQRQRERVWRIYVINADGTDEQDLRIAGQHPSWAPDNQRFVYRGCDLSGNRCGLWLANAVAVKPWDTGQNMLGPLWQEAEASHPDWSPVSDEIAYQSPAAGSWDIWLIDARALVDPAQARPRRVTSSPAIEGLPTWSPDGQWIAYLSDAGGNWGIWIVRPDGSQLQRLFAYDGGVYQLPVVAEPYGARDWWDEQLSWAQ